MIHPTSIIGWCPACDAGNIHQVALTGLSQRASLCEECEALWLGDETPNPDSFWQLSRYMRAHGATSITRVVTHDDGTETFAPW